MSSTNETENTTTTSVVDASTAEPNETTASAAAPAAEEKVVEENATAVTTEPAKSSASSWFTTFALPPNLSTQLTTLSSSLFQVTSKVSAAANTLVQKTLPQRPTTPTEGEPKEGNVENENENESVTNKDLTSLLTDFSSTVIKSAQQLKTAVEEKSLLGNFTKEHEKFLSEKRTQQRREEAAVPPWVGYVEEEEMKKQILELSKEKRNFLRSPPPGANYHFEMAAVYPVAMATLEIDENLKQMRFDLVPKQVTEEGFWCNYFYRVSLIKQSTQLSALASQNNANTTNDETRTLTTTTNERDRRVSDSQDKHQDINQEFVSEDYDTSAVSMDDIRREIEELTVPKKGANKTNAKKAGSPDESEWDKSLAEELENVSAEELEAQINQMLGGDTK